jgi:hypothetical protein
MLNTIRSTTLAGDPGYYNFKTGGLSIYKEKGITQYYNISKKEHVPIITEFLARAHFLKKGPREEIEYATEKNIFTWSKEGLTRFNGTNFSTSTLSPKKEFTKKIIAIIAKASYV